MRLAPEEAYELISVLDHAIERLHFLAILTPDILTHKTELAHLQGLEISRVIEEQHELEKRYEELVIQRSQLRALANKSKYKEKQHEIEEVARDLRFATKMLCRNLNDNPNVGSNLLKIEKERIALCEILQKTKDELENYEFNMLSNHVETERQQNELLKSTIAAERAASGEVVRTKDELRDEAEMRERERTAQNEEIANAKEELQELKAKTAVDTKYMVKEAKAHSACAKRVFATREAQMDARISTAQKQLDMEAAVSKDSVAFLETKHEQLQEEIQGWINKYDTDMEEMEKEIETLQTNKANTLIKLYELKEKLKEVEIEVEVEKEQMEERRKAAELLEKQTNAANIIQRNWRMYFARKELAAKKKAAAAKAKKAEKAEAKKGKKGAEKGKSPPKRPTTGTGKAAAKKK